MPKIPGPLGPIQHAKVQLEKLLPQMALQISIQVPEAMMMEAYLNDDLILKSVYASIPYGTKAVSWEAAKGQEKLLLLVIGYEALKGRLIMEGILPSED